MTHPDKGDAGGRPRAPRRSGVLLKRFVDGRPGPVIETEAEGKRIVAERLARLCGDDARILHDRSLGAGRRGHIDHLVVTTSGVIVIDTQVHPHATLKVRSTSRVFSSVNRALFVDGRNRTSLVDGLRRQKEAVEEALADLTPRIPVTAVLCFVDAEMPWSGAMTVRGFRVLSWRKTAKLVRVPGTLDAATRDSIARHLADGLPPL